MTSEPRIDELPTKLGHALHQIEAQSKRISLLEMSLIGTVSALAGYFIGALFSVPAMP